MLLIRIGAVNAAKRGISIHQQLEAFVKEHPIHIVVLPESNLPEWSAIGYCISWRAYGLCVLRLRLATLHVEAAACQIIGNTTWYLHTRGGRMSMGTE